MSSRGGEGGGGAGRERGGEGRGKQEGRGEGRGKQEGREGGEGKGRRGRVCVNSTRVPFPAKDVVRKIEQTKTGAMDHPEKDIVISECGVLPLEEPFTVDRE